MAKFEETRFSSDAAKAMADEQKFSFLTPEIKCALLIDFRWVVSEQDLKDLCDRCLLAFDSFTVAGFRLCPSDNYNYSNPFDPVASALRAAFVTSFSKMVLEKLDRWKAVGLSALAMRRGLTDAAFQAMLCDRLNSLTPCEVSQERKKRGKQKKKKRWFQISECINFKFCFFVSLPADCCRGVRQRRYGFVFAHPPVCFSSPPRPDDFSCPEIFGRHVGLCRVPKGRLWILGNFGGCFLESGKPGYSEINCR